MSPSGESPRRLVVMTVVACAVLLIVAAATALGQTWTSHEPSEPAAQGPTGAGASRSPFRWPILPSSWVDGLWWPARNGAPT